MPTTDSEFLWMMALCILTSPSAFSVRFCQYGLLMGLRTKVTAKSFGISFPAAISYVQRHPVTITFELLHAVGVRYLELVGHMMSDQSERPLAVSENQNRSRERGTGRAGL